MRRGVGEDEGDEVMSPLKFYKKEKVKMFTKKVIRTGLMMALCGLGFIFGAKTLDPRKLEKNEKAVFSNEVFLFSYTDSKEDKPMPLSVTTNGALMVLVSILNKSSLTPEQTNEAVGGLIKVFSTGKFANLKFLPQTNSFMGGVMGKMGSNTMVMGSLYLSGQRQGSYGFTFVEGRDILPK